MTVQRGILSLEQGQLSRNFLGRSFSAVFLYGLFLTVALLALFLPSFGPMLDHHMAERNPYHAHIYLSPAGAGHVHFYEDAHYHVHHHRDSNPVSPTLPGDGSGNSEVVYLTSNDGLGQSLTSLAFTSLHVDVVYPAPDDRNFLPEIVVEDVLPPGTFTAPPRRPPRV